MDMGYVAQGLGLGRGGARTLPTSFPSKPGASFTACPDVWISKCNTAYDLGLVRGFSSSPSENRGWEHI